MLTLGTLLALPSLNLRLLVGEQDLGREIRWVHITEQLDVDQFLRGGELILTHGSGLPPGAAAGEYLGRLHAAGAAALGFGVGDQYERAPIELLERARKLGFVVFEVPDNTSFLAVSRAVYNEGRRSRSARRRTLSNAQREMVNLVVGGGVELDVTARLAKNLGGWALVVEPGGEPIAVSPPSAATHLPRVREELDRMRQAGRSASSSWAADDQVCSMQTVQVLDDPVAYLAVGAPDLSGPAVDLVQIAISGLMFMHHRRQTEKLAARGLQAALLYLVLQQQAAEADAAAHCAGVRLPAEPVRVVAFDVLSTRVELLLDLIDRDPGMQLVGAMAARVGTERRVHLVHSATPEDQQRLEALLHGCGGGLAAMSDPVPVDNASTAMQAVHRMLEVHHADPAQVQVLTSKDLRDIRLLDHMDSPSLKEYARALLEPLVSTPDGNKVDLIRTLQAFLEHNCHWDATSSALGVHRHTLRYRLRKAEDLLGRSLDDTAVRAELWFALHLADDEHR
ncbi:PucR family transcriptional regulator [Pseudonocardiaceae bacterium YIM PH 21723]|nr:PucR family transcriptional regulator [Pseudonocardiaceae bacterium YIM PH 21723]